MAGHGDTLVVVLGASGRVGRELLPQLVDMARISVIAVGRQLSTTACVGNVSRLAADLTTSNGRNQVIGSVSQAGRRPIVVLVDLVLDRSTVTAMRDSIAAATAATRELAAVFAPSCRLGLVCGSTTAVLAPWPYRTPYGIAKGRQLAEYAGLAIPGEAVLLPTLSKAPHPTDRNAWTFAAAATHLAQSIARISQQAPDHLRISVPHGTAMTGDPVRRRRLTLRSVGRVGLENVASWTTRRDSPAAHRLASHGRLDLTPAAVRRTVDHHVAPAPLVHRLSRKLNTPVLGVP